MGGDPPGAACAACASRRRFLRALIGADFPTSQWGAIPPGTGSLAFCHFWKKKTLVDLIDLIKSMGSGVVERRKGTRSPD
jgi:hypothetical protein